MSSYREIQDTEVAVDAPITQQLMQSLRDNILAIQEGDSATGTPRILAEAFEPVTVGNQMVAYFDASFRDSYNNQPFSNAVPFDTEEMIIGRAGNYRIRLFCQGQNDEVRVQAKFQRAPASDPTNFTDIGANSPTATSTVVSSANLPIALNVGDRVRLRKMIGDGVGNSLTTAYAILGIANPVGDVSNPRILVRSINNTNALYVLDRLYNIQYGIQSNSATGNYPVYFA